MPQLKYKGKDPVFAPRLGGEIKPGQVVEATAAQVQEFRSQADWEVVPEVNPAPKPSRPAKPKTEVNDDE